MGARKKDSSAINRKKGQTEDEAVLQRVAANHRERQRTKQLNEAFDRLRRSIPVMPCDKMSKIHTLRIASDYIHFLAQIRNDGGKVFGCELPAGEDGQLSLRTSFNMWRGVSTQALQAVAASGTDFMSNGAFRYEPTGLGPTSFYYDHDPMSYAAAGQAPVTADGGKLGGAFGMKSGADSDEWYHRCGETFAPASSATVFPSAFTSATMANGGDYGGRKDDDTASSSAAAADQRVPPSPQS